MPSRHLLIVAAVAAVSWGAWADTIYVDDDNCPGPGSGTPGDPYCSIQTAIDNAAPHFDEIVVAPGTYFEMIDFLGKAIWLHSSDGPAVTIIDAQQALGSVVTCANGEGPYTILDGFTITGGTGQLYGPFSYGGGVYVYLTSPTVRNCVLYDNTAQNGGGAGIIAGSPTFESCIFDANSSGYGGGGLYTQGNSPAVIDDCTFANNSAGSWGGGARLNSDVQVTGCLFEANTAERGAGCALGQGSPTLTQCVFTGNIAQDHGGGLLAGPYGDHWIADCHFEGNQAVEGGGAYIEPNHLGQGSAAMEGCVLIANTATVGGGLAVRDIDAASISDCQLSDNIAIVAGGAIHTVLSSPQITNCTFTGNGVEPAYGEGGALYISEESSPAVSACTFTGNTAGFGGAVFAFLNAAPAYDGCAFVGNVADSGGAACNFLAGGVSFTGCTFSMNSAESDGGAMWNRLCDPVLSQCTIADNTAENGGGLFNLEVALTLHDVMFDGNWANLWAGGLYGEDTVVDLTGCTFRFNCAQHQAGGGMSLDGCDNAADPMEISDCVFRNNEGSPGAIDFSADCHAYLLRCEIANNTDEPDYGEAIEGGQVLMEDCLISGNAGSGASVWTSSTYELRHCTINADELTSVGQLLVADCDFTNGRVVTESSGTARVERCTFIGGTAGSHHSSQLTVSDCTFRNCDWQGVFADAATFVTNCVFRDSQWGVRAYGGSQPLEMVNCVFTGCSVGLVNVFHHNVHATNCTFQGNTQAIHADSVYGDFIVENSIIADPIDVDEDDIVINYSDVVGEGFDSGIGNIKADPLFVNPATGNLRLLAGSPCIDAADNTAVPADAADIDGDGDTTEATPLDLDGLLRFHDDPVTTDTGVAGNGHDEVVDMGAYEFHGPLPPCPCDCENPSDGTVDVGDFLALVAQWGGPGPCDCEEPPDGAVDVGDFLALLAGWGACP